MNVTQNGPSTDAAHDGRPWWSRRWRSPTARRRAGRTMVAVAAAGALTAVAGTAVGWIFVGQLNDTTTESIDVTEQALDAVDDTIDLADDVLVSTNEAVGALAEALEAVSGSFDAATGAIDDIADLATTIGPSLDEATSTIRQLESVGGTIDGVLGALSNIPFGPDYDPADGLGDTFGGLADSLEPVPGDLETTADGLNEFTESAAGLQEQLDELAASVRSVDEDLAATDRLVDQYRASVADARGVAQRADQDLDGTVTLLRVLLVIGGLALLFGQIVPLWMGRELLDVPEPEDRSRASNPA